MQEPLWGPGHDGQRRRMGGQREAFWPPARRRERAPLHFGPQRGILGTGAQSLPGDHDLSQRMVPLLPGRVSLLWGPDAIPLFPLAPSSTRFPPVIVVAESVTFLSVSGRDAQVDGAY